MGDAGALFLGILMASLSIRLKPDFESSAASMLTPILLLAVPILDTCVAVISRISRGISPLQGGKDHLSHRLLKKNHSKKITAMILWSLTSFFASIPILQLITSRVHFLFGVGLSVWIFLFFYFHSLMKFNR